MPHPNPYPEFVEGTYEHEIRPGVSRITPHGAGLQVEGKINLLGTQVQGVHPKPGFRSWLLLHDTDFSVYPVLIHSAGLSALDPSYWGPR